MVAVPVFIHKCINILDHWLLFLVLAHQQQKKFNAIACHFDCFCDLRQVQSELTDDAAIDYVLSCGQMLTCLIIVFLQYRAACLQLLLELVEGLCKI